MLSVENHAGRLIELRFFTPAQRGDVDSVERTIRRLLAAFRAPAIVCADLREARVLDPATATRVVERMRTTDRRVERDAILLPADDAIAGMQMDRLVREANAESRRAFRSPVELAGWLDAVLTPRERARLTVFLHGKPARPLAG
jgi:hypothetical protein